MDEVNGKRRKLRRICGVSIKRKLRMLASCVKDLWDGVDFTIPDRMYDRGRNDGAMYYATPENVLRKVFELVDPRRFPGFLDIGSGKGFVLWKAWEYGFSKVGGVEYDERLVRVCKENMEKLGVGNKVEISCCDAGTYSQYGNYDVFYFFNPFSDSMMNAVMHRIIEQCRGKEIMIIYFRPRYPQAIENSGLFRLEHQYYDKVTRYAANIYRGWVPGGDFLGKEMPRL